MSSPLIGVWEAAAGSPYHPAVGKGTQFTVGFTLLFISMLVHGAIASYANIRPALVLGALFGLSMHLPLSSPQDSSHVL